MDGSCGLLPPELATLAVVGCRSFEIRSIRTSAPQGLEPPRRFKSRSGVDVGDSMVVTSVAPTGLMMGTGLVGTGLLGADVDPREGDEVTGRSRRVFGEAAPDDVECKAGDPTRGGVGISADAGMTLDPLNDGSGVSADSMTSSKTPDGLASGAWARSC